MNQEGIREVKFVKDASIVVQDSVNPGYFFIVRSGRVVVDSEHMLVDHELSYYEPGDSFGLVSAMTGHRYLVTLYAETEVVLLQIPIKLLGTYLKGTKELAMKILGLYSRELRSLQKHLSRANRPADRTYHPERLLLNAKTYISWDKPELASYSLTRFIEWSKSSGSMTSLSEAEQLLNHTRTNYSGPKWENNQMKLKAGEVLFLESENSNEIYVVIEGSVKLFSIVRGMEYVIDVLSAGEIFGEMSLIDNAPRLASAVTETDSIILQVTADNIFESVGDALLQKIFESIARRIWFSHQRLVILRIKEPIARLYAYLYNSIRDKDIRLGRGVTESQAESYSFPMSIEELSSMCGIIKLKTESMREFLSDSNIQIQKGRITVKSRKRLEDKLGSYKTRGGQISASPE
jgi:CRP/FNR family cyclic AMP-dependent transcriptional regulator